MKKVYLKLISEHVDLKSEPPETVTKIIKEYDYFTHGVNSERVNNLINSIRKVREDWIAFDVTDGNDIYINISLLSAFEGNNEDTVPNEIILLLEEFFKPEKLLNLFPPTDCEITKREEGLEIDQEAPGILLQIEGHSTIEELEAIKALKKENINFEYITTNFTATDVGAGSFVATVIIYVLDAAASGIISDLVKAGLTKINPFSQDNSNDEDTQTLDYFNYKKLLKDVSQRTNIKSKSLTLTDLRRTDKKMVAEFRANNSICTVVCNDQYVIQKLKLREIENSPQSI